MRGKNKMKSKIVFLCGALAFALSGAAEAQVNTGLYGGIGIGQARAKLNRDDFTLNAPSLVEERADETNTAYKFFGGYQLNRYFAAELSYTDFGKFAYIYSTAALGGGESKVSYRANSLATSAIVSVPLGRSGFSLLGRAGVTYNTAERSGLSGNSGIVTVPPIGAATKHRTSALFGAGVEYAFTPTLGMRLDFEDYGRFGKGSIPDGVGGARIHMWSLDFMARF